MTQASWKKELKENFGMLNFMKVVAIRQDLEEFIENLLAKEKVKELKKFKTYIPKKKKKSGHGLRANYKYANPAYPAGWNACRDEILEKMEIE